MPIKHHPDSVIIDDTVYGFCTNFGMPPKSPMSALTYQQSKDLHTLPIDLDLEKMSVLGLYAQQQLYPAIGGKIKPIVSQSQADKGGRINKYHLSVGKRQLEETYLLKQVKTLSVDLVNDNNEE